LHFCYKISRIKALNLSSDSTSQQVTPFQIWISEFFHLGVLFNPFLCEKLKNERNLDRWFWSAGDFMQPIFGTVYRISFTSNIVDRHKFLDECKVGSYRWNIYRNFEETQIEQLIQVISDMRITKIYSYEVKYSFISYLVTLMNCKGK
jgi:hypothetical protein